ncbi:MAG TPA: hypothetical protein VMB50_11365, partial [Myxococcales bacterium]|nr:hypothetical protein [Myxococcales bacterium]
STGGHHGTSTGASAGATSTSAGNGASTGGASTSAASSTSTGAAASTSGGGGSSTGGNVGTSTGGGSSTGAGVGTSTGGGGSTTGTSTGSGSTTSASAGGYLGVLERGGGPLRNAVFQDAAFTQAAVSDANTGLHVDGAFTSATWSGPVFSQPLYFVDTATSQSMVIVTTDSNEIYAVDPGSGATIWADTSAAGGATVLPKALATSHMQCGGSVSPIGITGTPVIDPVARVLYANVGSLVSSKAHYQIYAIDLDDGSTVSGWPIDLEGLPMSLGNGNTGTFTSKLQNQRGSLALVNGVLYVPYGGLDGDCGNYSGVVAAVPVANPGSAAIWATSAPSGSGIWGPSGVASDGTSVFVSTGNTNSPFPTAWNNANSEAVIRLAAGTPPVFSGAAGDYFAPSDPTGCDWYCDDTEDADLGSSGVVLFDYPGSQSTSQLAFAIGKTSNAYLLDRTNLGGISTGLSEISGASSQVFGSMAAYSTASGTYVVATASGNGSCSGNTAAFAVTGDPPQLGGGWCSGNGGTGSPIVSTSDGTHDYLVWVTGGNLSALDGDTGNVVASLGIPDGNYTHWVTPIVAQGALYLAGNGELMKFDP